MTDDGGRGVQRGGCRQQTGAMKARKRSRSEVCGVNAEVGSGRTDAVNANAGLKMRRGDGTHADAERKWVRRDCDEAQKTAEWGERRTDDGVRDIARIRTARAMDSGRDKLQTQVVGVVVDVDTQGEACSQARACVAYTRTGKGEGYRGPPLVDVESLGIDWNVISRAILCACGVHVFGGIDGEHGSSVVDNQRHRVSALSVHSTVREETRDSSSASHRDGRREDKMRPEVADLEPYPECSTIINRQSQTTAATLKRTREKKNHKELEPPSSKASYPPPIFRLFSIASF
ncbi:hypothetical protein C8R44DRAFT_742040 [Mycena epipterygia]|nr:hypothetical protein C8R44DRAFT_742040 [Mycena epipterygia]